MPMETLLFPSVVSAAALFLRAITGKLRSQNPERRRSGGYRDASTAQGGRSVLPASLSMTMGVIAVGKLRPDEPGPLDGRGRPSLHGQLGCGDYRQLISAHDLGADARSKS